MSSEELATNKSTSTQRKWANDEPVKELDSTEIRNSGNLTGYESSTNPSSRDVTPSGKEVDSSLKHIPANMSADSSTSDTRRTQLAVDESPRAAEVSADTTEQLAERTELLDLEEENMEDSKATIKPTRPTIEPTRSPTPPPPPPKDELYLDPTPRTPLPSGPPSRTPSNADSVPYYDEKVNNVREGKKAELKLVDIDTGEKKEEGDDSKSEIQSIMDQFDEEGGGPGVEEVMSPRLEFAGPLLGSPVQHPPRKSSLEPMRAGSTNLVEEVHSVHEKTPPAAQNELSPPVPPKEGSVRSLNLQSPALHKPQPPEPDPEPDLPFDFHRFLEQLRHRAADPVAKFLRSFLLEFGKKQWMVHEQVKIISDFLTFISVKMGQVEVWRDVSDAEFDNAREGMEKLVMNRLYSQTFSPAIPLSQPLPAIKGKRKNLEKVLGPERRGQHQEDVERDGVLAQKVQIYGWVKEIHLDIPPVDASGHKFLHLAQQELLKIKGYRAPRDKVICVLNCCKVIFGLLRHSQSDQSADSFVPLLIYVVLQANPEHLVSNLQYILRFRNQDKLNGEAGYYLSSLMAAVQFIENLDRTSLTISDKDFEKNVEAAVSAIAEKHADNLDSNDPRLPQQFISEKSTLVQPEVTPRNSMDGENAAPRKSTSSREGSESTADAGEEHAAVAGLLRSIQKPLSTIGRIFSEDTSTPSYQERSSSLRSGHPVSTPQPGSTPRRSPNSQSQSQRSSSEMRRPGTPGASSALAPQTTTGREDQKREIYRLSAEDAAARQASAETAEAQRIQRAEFTTVVDTLSAMFPALDKEVIADVVTLKEGRVGQAVEACLALSAGA